MYGYEYKFFSTLEFGDSDINIYRQEYMYGLAIARQDPEDAVQLPKIISDLLPFATILCIKS